MFYVKLTGEKTTKIAANWKQFNDYWTDTEKTTFHLPDFQGIIG